MTESLRLSYSPRKSTNAVAISARSCMTCATEPCLLSSVFSRSRSEIEAAILVAMCAARQNKFWPAHDILFKYQETWAPLKNPSPFLLSLIDTLKLPSAPMTACLEQSETQLEIRSDAEGATKAGAQSTPTFYIEGGLIVGAQPVQFFIAILDSIYAVKTKKATP